MLEILPASLGRALRGARPGLEKVVWSDPALADREESILVTSPAFEDGGELPVQYTADRDGNSPSLQWQGAPADAASSVLLIEDADSPTPHPLVHAIAWGLAGGDGALAERALPTLGAGRLGSGGAGPAMGRNSYLRTGYLPPDPPPGHGPHRYAFQIFALDIQPYFQAPPGRSRLVELLRDHAIAKGLLIGTYERG